MIARTDQHLPARLVERLGEAKSSHFALVTGRAAAHTGALPDVYRQLEDEPTLRGHTVVGYRCVEAGGVLEWDGEGLADAGKGAVLEVGERLRAQLLSLKAPGIVVFGELERFSLEHQMHLLGLVRSVRDAAGRRCFQAVFAGCWNTTLVLETWKVVKHGDSAPLDTRNILISEAWSRDGIRKHFDQWVNREYHEVAREALRDLIWAYTAGDGRLVDLLYEELCDFGTVDAKTVESCLMRMPEREAVQESIRAGLARLPSSAAMKLSACLRLGAINLAEKDPDRMWLELSGAVRSSGGGMFRIASPIVDRVLRGQCLASGAGPCAPAEEILPEWHPTLAQASRIVSETECLLRNLIVSRLAVSSTGGHPLHVAQRLGDDDLFDRVSRRRSEDQKNLGIHLIQSPLSAYLDVADLHAYVTNSKLYADHFAIVFDDKAEFETRFAEFSRLRNAIAHNKVCSVSVIAALATCRDWFLVRIAAAARKDAEREDPGGLATIVSGSEKVDFIAAKNELKAYVELRNQTADSLYDVRVEGESRDSSGTVIVKVITEQPVSLTANGVSRVTLVGRHKGPTPSSPWTTRVSVVSARRSR